MLNLKVKNSGEVFQYRAGYAFEVGQTRADVFVPASQYNEVAQAPNLDVTILGADSENEIPNGATVNIRATDAAKRLARELGVDILTVPSDGDQITAPEVKAYASEQQMLTRRDFIPTDADGNLMVSTLDPPEVQRAAQKASLEQMKINDDLVRAHPETASRTGTAEAPQPDATNRARSSDLDEPSPVQQQHTDAAQIERGHEST